MNNRIKKKLILAFRDGDKWALEEAHKKYSHELTALLSYVYKMEATLATRTINEIYKETQQALQLKEEDDINKDKLQLKIELKKKGEVKGELHIREKYFSNFLQETEMGARANGVATHTMKKKEMKLLFQYVFKKWKRKAKRVIKSENEKTRSAFQNLSIQQYLQKEAEINMKWLMDHPEREQLRKMKANDDPTWKSIRQSFIDQANGRFLEEVPDMALDVFRKRLQDNDFRLFCNIHTWLFAIARNLHIKQLDQTAKLKKLIAAIGNQEHTEPTAGLSKLEESTKRIKQLKQLLFFYNLMLRAKHGGMREIRKINALIDKFYRLDGEPDLTWAELAEKYGFASSGAIRVAITTYKKQLKEQLSSLADNLSFGKILYKYGNEEKEENQENSFSCIGIIIFDYLPEDIKFFLPALKKIAYDQVLFIGRAKNHQCTPFAQLCIQEGFESYIVNDSIHTLPTSGPSNKVSFVKNSREALNAAKAKAREFSIILLDSTIHGSAGSIDIEKAITEYQLMNEVLFNLT